MRYDYHIKLISNGEVIDTILLLANTNYQAKKEFYRDVAESAYYKIWNLTKPSAELHRNDGKLIKIYNIGETKND